MDTISNFAVPVICKDVSIRNALVKKCDAVLEIRPIVGGSIVRQPFFSKYMQFDIACPNALLIHNQGLYFGNNPNITGGDIEVIKRIFA